jgi:hypothetical protein
MASVQAELTDGLDAEHKRAILAGDAIRVFDLHP